MTVVGSYKDNIAFDKVRVNLMMRDTVNESVDKIQELVRINTPIGKTGHLWDSVKTKGARRTSPYSWQGEVYSQTDYTAAIEYGMAPQKIEGKNGGGLSFFWEKKGVQFVGRSVKWPGYQGHHMFQRGAAAFERLYAEDIAEDNARIWLGSVDAGRRTVAF